MAFFYSLPENRNITISHILKSSLSKVLSFYYPFAGQMKDDNTYVDCNDTGVEYLNVQVSCPMSEILNHPYNDVVEVVFPPDLPWSDSSNRSLLVVQLSEFDCGGIALSVCLSQRIADGYSVGKFFKDWASVARDDELDFKPSPQFNGASLFPLTNGPPVLTSPNTGDQPQRNVSRMYHLSSSNLDKLKVDATNSGVVQNPTRIEVATALVHKCATSALGVSKPIVLVHAMNLRPPIPLNTIGNCVTIFTLTEADMFVFQSNKKLLQFASPIGDQVKIKDTTCV